MQECAISIIGGVTDMQSLAGSGFVVFSDNSIVVFSPRRWVEFDKISDKMICQLIADDDDPISKRHFLVEQELVANGGKIAKTDAESLASWAEAVVGESVAGRPSGLSITKLLVFCVDLTS